MPCLTEYKQILQQACPRSAELADVCRQLVARRGADHQEAVPTQNAHRFRIQNGTMWVNPKSGWRFCFPEVANPRSKILHEWHDTRLIGHPGVDETLLTARKYSRRRTLDKDGRSYAEACHACKRGKTSSWKPGGRLQPPPVPQGLWQDISVSAVHLIHPSLKTGALKLAELLLLPAFLFPCYRFYHVATYVIRRERRSRHSRAPIHQDGSLHSV